MAINVTNSSQKLHQLYETDFAEWVDQTVKLLKQGNLNELDLENLIEEIEGLNRRDKRAMQSRLIVLFVYLLLYAYQPEIQSNSWIATIDEKREQILETLRDSPSLKIYLTESFASCYERARTRVAHETGLAINTFPEKSPFSEADILATGWLP